MTMTASGSSGFTFPDGSTQATAGFVPFRNRIINGAMMIDQRNAGASVTSAAGVSSGSYTVDRWTYGKGTAGAFTVQQSAVAPAGFKNSVQLTVTTAVTPAATDFFFLRQMIEGLNLSDLGWGTVNAQSVTLSFWIRCSVTGTYNWSFLNSAETRGYVASFTINAANTWEYKTLTIPGDTSGTWLTDTGVGLRLLLDLGTGSTYSTTAGSWQTFSFPYGLSGATKFISNAGATMNITGVQLEKGSVATPFEVRPYGTELALCERYCYAHNGRAASSGVSWNSTTLYVGYQFPVTMRTAPSITVLSLPQFSAGGFSMNASSLSINGPTNQYCWLIAGVSGATSGQAVIMGSGGINFEAEL